MPPPLKVHVLARPCTYIQAKGPQLREQQQTEFPPAETRLPSPWVLSSISPPCPPPSGQEEERPWCWSSSAKHLETDLGPRTMAAAPTVFSRTRSDLGWLTSTVPALCWVLRLSVHTSLNSPSKGLGRQVCGDQRTQGLQGLGPQKGGEAEPEGLRVQRSLPADLRHTVNEQRQATEQKQLFHQGTQV